MRTLAALLVIAASLLIEAQSYAATISVNETNDELNTDGDCSLREAIQAANANVATDACPSGQNVPVIDEIVIPAGTYTLTRAGINNDTNSTGDLDIAQSVRLSGAGSALTIIQAGATPHAGIDRVLHITSGGTKTIFMTGLTIQNGCANNNAGACGGPGGGVEINSAGTVEIADCVVQGNRGSVGGGLHPYAGGSLQTNVSSTIFRNNIANVSGGGVSTYNPTFLDRVVISGNNTAFDGNGGGLAVVAGTTILRNSVVSGNSSVGRGGGIAVQGSSSSTFGTLVAVNVTISGNRAEGHGGGIFVNGGVVAGTNYGCAPSSCSVRLANATIVNNVADNTSTWPSGDGGGVFVGATGAAPGTLAMRNSIIAGNSDLSGGTGAFHDCSNGAAVISSFGFNLIGNDLGCSFVSGSGDLRGVSAGVGGLANNGGGSETHALIDGSAAIDGGDPAGCIDEASPPSLLAVDQRGLSRVQFGRCDIGAFERQDPCGNGAVDAGEECDDGNRVGGDGCDASCQLEGFCGDGAIGVGEECDDANSVNGDGCDDLCQLEPYCSDGTLDAGEECDDSNLVNGDGCNDLCQLEPYCSDGSVDAGEECDDANLLNGDGCDEFCQLEPFCGDGTLDAGEECDDSNLMNGDGCDASCQLEPYCSDGAVDPGEECDDSNLVSGDGCDASCQLEPYCGDGTCDAGESSATCAADCPLPSTQPNLTIQSAPSPTTPGLNQTVVVTLTYQNTGTAPATGVVITAEIPTNGTYAAAASAPTTWSCADGSGPIGLCTTTLPALAPGATGTVRFAYVHQAGRIYHTAWITDDGTHGADSDITNNGVSFVNDRSFKSYNLGPVRYPANISHALIPAAYDGTTDYPLIIFLHGLGSQSFGATLDGAFNFRFSQGVNTHGYFLVYGKGVGRVHAPNDPYSAARPAPHWNSTDVCCTGSATAFQLNWQNDVDDVAYLTGVITEALNTFRIDPSRVFLAGYSNGAAMSWRLACEIPEMIAAIAAVSGAPFDNAALCPQSEPVSVLHVRGHNDRSVTFYDYNYDHDFNPNTPPILDRVGFPGAVRSIAQYAARAGCDTNVLTPTGTINILRAHQRPDPPTPPFIVGAGNDTNTYVFETGCHPNYDFEFWEMPHQDHGLYFEYEAAMLGGQPFPADRIIQWLLARPKL